MHVETIIPTEKPLCGLEKPNPCAGSSEFHTALARRDNHHNTVHILFPRLGKPSTGGGKPESEPHGAGGNSSNNNSGGSGLTPGGMMGIITGATIGAMFIGI